ncbi:MAG: hypothetical protein ACRDID_12585 [Ktedonobacterales bacterium]
MFRSSIVSAWSNGIVRLALVALVSLGVGLGTIAAAPMNSVAIPVGSDPMFAQIVIHDTNSALLQDVIIQVRAIPHSPANGVVTDSLIATGKTDSRGRVIVPKVSAPTSPDLRSPDGVVNYAIYVVGTSGVPLLATTFSSYYGSNQARAQAFTSQLHENAVARLPAATSAQFHATPQPSSLSIPNCPAPYWTVVADYYAYTTVGELHTVPNFSSAQFVYGNQADSNISTEVSASGTSGWSASGTINMSYSQATRVTRTANNWFGYHQDAQFHYQKQREVYCTPLNAYRLLPIAWTGSMHDGAYEGNLDNVPNGYTITVNYNSTFQTNTERAYTYGGAASVSGASISAQSGYSTYVELNWATPSNQQGFLYGNNNYPTQSQLIYASTYCPFGHTC